nr:RING/FYVE/PHD zinc finger superfamily protein isoform 5 [Ipomoea batatas]
MGEHLLVYVDRIVKPDEARSIQPVQEANLYENRAEMVGPSSSSSEKEEDEMMEDEGAPLIGIAECRICQEEESINNLEIPCSCSGSLKPYQPGYTAPPRSPPEDTIIDIGGGWQISGVPLDLHDPRFLALAEAERQILEAEYDDYHATSASGAAFCRSVALILMALLLLRHAMSVTDGEGGEEEDPSAMFSGGGLSFAMLHHGLGNQHFAAAKTKRGGCSTGSDAVCVRGAISATKRHAVHHSISCTCNACSSRTSITVVESLVESKTQPRDSIPPWFKLFIAPPNLISHRAYIYSYGSQKHCLRITETALVFPCSKASKFLLPIPLKSTKTMNFTTRHAFMLLIFIGLLAVHQEGVSAIRDIDHFLRLSGEDVRVTMKNSRVLEQDVATGLNTHMKPMPTQKKLDPYQSSKRTVHKGSDPIHNRS